MGGTEQPVNGKLAGQLRTYSTKFSIAGGDDCAADGESYVCNMRKGHTCKTINLVMPWVLCHILVKVDSGVSTVAEFATRYT